MTLDFKPTDFDAEVDPENFKLKVTSLIIEILREQFPNDREKQDPFPREERFNFACPYCGDSAKDSRKKRANVYYEGYGFHCYNCKRHTNIEAFLKDFGKSLDASETIHARNIHSNAISSFQESNKTMDASYLINPQLLETYAVPLEAIMRKYQLTKIDAPGNTWVKKYLLQRHQTNFTPFAWDKKLMRLYIFNFTKEGKVLGYQIRNFKTEPKYVTHTLEMIYKEFEITVPNNDDFKEINRLSFLFGISTADFSQEITVLEGPLDSFLIKNGMSTCGIDNDFPFEISNVKYMYDMDKDGIEKSLEMLQRGEKVFLWKKYLKDIGINIYKKKLDYTDLITLVKEEKKNLLPLSGYFSSSKYDSYYV